MAGIFDRIRGLNRQAVQEQIDESVSNTPPPTAADIYADHEWMTFPIGSNVVTQRQGDVTYVNNTESLIQLWVRCESSLSVQPLRVILNEGQQNQQTFSSGTLSITVNGSLSLGGIDIKPGETYKATGRTIAEWRERRKV